MSVAATRMRARLIAGLRGASSHTSLIGNVSVEAEAGGCELSTETRIAYFGGEARRRFRAYWLFVRPFSGFLRRSLLAGIKRRAEEPET